MNYKKDLFEACLHRAAESIGDITSPAMGRLYARFPEARCAFDAHARGNRDRLEAQMVETALFCVMRWFEEPFEVVSLLTSSVPHHQMPLKVELSWYSGLITAVLDTIASVIPADADDELAVCADVRRRLVDAVCAAT